MNEKEVVAIFENAGFEIKHPEKDLKQAIKLTKKISRPHDFIPEYKNLRVLADYKNYPTSDTPKYTELIHDQSKLKVKGNAKVALLCFNKKIIPEHIKEYGRKNGVYLWDNHNLKYYKILSETIGEYAKYEIIASLGLKTDEEKNMHSVLALKYKQPNKKSKTTIYSFSMHPENLLKIAVVLRKASLESNNYQRIVNRKRLSSISKYIDGKKSILPNSILLALSKKVEETKIRIKDEKHISNQETKLVRLNIPLEYASAEVIDGQHRLFGFIHSSESNIKNFNLNVVGVKGLNEENKKDLFVSINDNARRIDPNLVAHLLHTENETKCKKNPRLMAIKIVMNLNKQGLFKNKIRIHDIGKEEITLKGFSGYDLTNLLGKRGILKKTFPENSSKKYIAKINQYFTLIKNTYPGEWDDPNYMLSTNRGITAFLKLLKRILINKNDWNKKEIIKIMTALKNSDFDWSKKALKNKYIGGGGWKKFYEDIIEAIRKKYPAFKKS